jgi:hypothetical protein
MSQPLDGNALAGPLGGLFTAELTNATVLCAGCGRSDVFGAGTVYGAPMGLVLRCIGCGEALLRYAESPGKRTLDMRGIAALRITTAGQA